MKKTILLFIVLSLTIIIFFAREGIIFQTKILSEQIFYKCYSLRTDSINGCMNAYYYTLAQQEGARVAITHTRNNYEKFPNLQQRCHSIMHVIGRAAAERGDSIGTLFSNGDPFCWSGYYHGAVEGKFRAVQREDITPTFVNNFCNDIPKTTENYFNYYNCIHGSGHAFMYVSRNDLPYALGHCTMFSDRNDRQSCASGAFMENIIASQDSHTTAYIKDSEPYLPCTLIESTPFIDTCYSTQSTMFWGNAKNPQDAFMLCDAIPHVASKNACIEGLGREIAGTSLNSIQKTLTNCAYARTPETYSVCIVGAMKNFISYYHDDILATKLCASLDQSTRTVCDAVREDFIKIFSTTTLSAQ